MVLKHFGPGTEYLLYTNTVKKSCCFYKPSYHVYIVKNLIYI